MEKLILKEFAGQRCDVTIFKSDKTISVQFSMTEGYGYPRLDLDKFKELLKKMENML